MYNSRSNVLDKLWKKIVNRVTGKVYASNESIKIEIVETCSYVGKEDTRNTNIKISISVTILDKRNNTNILMISVTTIFILDVWSVTAGEWCNVLIFFFTCNRIIIEETINSIKVSKNNRSNSYCTYYCH